MVFASSNEVIPTPEDKLYVPVFLDLQDFRIALQTSYT